MRFDKRTEDLIADFRGLPRTVSAASLRAPAPLDNLLVVLKERYKLEKPSAERALVENWEKIFGPTLAARCQPLAIREGRTLVVALANPTLRSELQFRKRDYLRKIQRLDYCQSIRDLRFTSG